MIEFLAQKIISLLTTFTNDEIRLILNEPNVVKQSKISISHEDS